MGIPPARNTSTFFRSLSTQITSWPTSAKQAPVTKPTYPVPTMLIFGILSLFPLHSVHRHDRFRISLQRQAEERRHLTRRAPRYVSLFQIPESIGNVPVVCFLTQGVLLFLPR